MRIILYKNKAERIKVNKESQLEQILVLEGNLRDAQSITSPSIIVNAESINSIVDDDSIAVECEGVTEIVTSPTLVLDCNYAYIEELNRFYFIESIITVSATLFQLNMSVDVLMTYQNEIKALNVYVDRNEYEFDPDTYDNEYVISEEQSISIGEYQPTTVFYNDDRGGNITYVVTAMDFNAISRGS